MAYSPSLEDIRPKATTASDSPPIQQNAANNDEEFSDYEPSLEDIRPKKPEDRSFTSKILPNMGVGFLEMGRNLVNAPHNIVSAINPRAGSHIPSMSREDDYEKMMGLPSTATLSDKIIRGLVQYAPTLAMPGAAMGVKGAMGVGSAAASMPLRIASAAVPNAAYGATQAEKPEEVGESAGYGALGGAIGPVIGKIINSLRPSKLLRGHLSDEELETNRQDTQGTRTGLGDVIESPTLKRTYENILPHVLGSGAEDTMAKNADVITGKGSTLLDNIRGKIPPGDYGEKLRKALEEASKEATLEKSRDYGLLNKAADKAGVLVSRKNFATKAKNILDKINSSKELKSETSPEIVSDLERYANNQEGQKLEATNIFRGKIGDKGNEAYMTPGKSFESGTYSQLKDALSKDIKEAFDNSNNKKLKSIYAQTQKNYAEKFAPFEDKDIVKFTRQGGDPDLLLSHFLKGGANDRATLLAKLTQKLKPADRNIPLVAHLSKALDEDGGLNPLKFSSLYSKLGSKQKLALAPNQSTRDALESYSNLVSKNKEGFNLMYNPKTGARGQGQRVLDAMLKIGQVVGGTAAGGPVGLAASTVGSSALGKLGTHLLTSPTLRDKLIKAMLENKNWKLPTTLGRTAAISSLAPGKKQPMMELENDRYAGYE